MSATAFEEKEDLVFTLSPASVRTSIIKNLLRAQEQAAEKGDGKTTIELAKTIEKIINSGRYTNMYSNRSYIIKSSDNTVKKLL